MHDTAYLHIRSRDGRATRIVPLSGPSVRVGRGRSCEVQLDDPNLSEVECLLRRRGDSWHLQPVQPIGRLTVDGRPADRPRPLPMGTTLRLADRWLTLLPTDDAPELDGPPPIEDEPAVEPDPSLRSEPTPDPSDSLDGRREELARWEARLKQRERWLTDRLHERQWEARWRAAGASLKSRSKLEGEDSSPAPPRPKPRPSSKTPIAPEQTIRPGREFPAPSPIPRVPEPTLRTARPYATPGSEPPIPRIDRTGSAEQPTRTAPPPIPRISPTDRRIESEPPSDSGPTLGSRSLRLTIEPALAEPRSLVILPEQSGEPMAGVVIDIDEEADPVETVPSSTTTGPGPEAEPQPEPEPEVAVDLVEVASEPAIVATRGDADNRLEVPNLVDEVETTQETGSGEFDRNPPAEPVAIEPQEPAIGADPAGESKPDPMVEPVEDRPEIEDDGNSDGTGNTPSGSTELVLASDLLESTHRGARTRIDQEPGGPEAPGQRPRAGWLSVPILGLNDVVSLLNQKDRAPESSEPVEVPEGPTRTPEPVAEASTAPTGEPEDSIPEPDLDPEGQPVEEGADHPTPETVEEPPRTAIPAPGGDWPTARAILGAQPSGGRRRASSRPRTSASFPVPTARVSPDEWTIPGGAVLCIPMMFLALAAGVVGVKVAWSWGVLDRESGKIADRLASGKRPEPGSIDRLIEREAELPMASWRNSTADAMIARAALLSGPGPGFDPASQERAGSLIHAAGATSPNHPSVRFARGWRAVQEPGVDPISMAVGLSRDIWPMAWSGRSLLELGKIDEAKRAYARALDLACRAEPDPSADPTFHAEPRGGRFGMPMEEVVGVVIADMADRPEWSTEDWEPLVPDSALAWLVAARTLRQRGDPSADRALERAIALADEPAPPGCSEAIHLAAGAEAMALDGRVDPAVEAYRRAVDRLMPAEEAARRPWMFNLAELLGRLDDRDAEREALLAAMITDPNDPVTAEAIRAQLRRGVDLVGSLGGEGDERQTFGE